MKSLVRNSFFKSIGTKFSLLTLMFLCLFWVMPAKGQFSELELIGKRSQPYTITIGNETVPGVPVSRTVIPLGNQPVPVTITFRDTNLGSFTDTIFPTAGTRLVYRIAETEVHKALLNGGFFQRMKALFTGEEHAGQSEHIPTFCLKFLEQLPITEPIRTDVHISANPQDSIALSVRISADYQFSRDSSTRVQRQDTHIIPPAKSADTATKATTTQASAAPQGATALTPQQHQLLLTNLNSKKFEDDKVQFLQSALKGVYLTSQQLSVILLQFDFERSKLQVCKQYYPQLTDKENTGVLYSVFDFESTKRELKQWIDEQPR
jgi:hypothetical protein